MILTRNATVERVLKKSHLVSIMALVRVSYHSKLDYGISGQTGKGKKQSKCCNSKEPAAVSVPWFV